MRGSTTSWLSFNLHLQAVSEPGTAAGQPVSAPAVLHSTYAVRDQAATRPVAARAAEAPAAAAAASSSSVGKPAASSSPSAASPACSAKPQTLSDRSSPVQIDQQEDVGDVDIGDDSPHAPDVGEAKVSASAAASAAHPAAKTAAAGAAHQAAKTAAARPAPQAAKAAPGAAVTGAEAAATSAQAGTAAEKAQVGHAASGAACTGQPPDAAAVEAAPPPPPPSAISTQTDTTLHIAALPGNIDVTCSVSTFIHLSKLYYCLCLACWHQQRSVTQICGCCVRRAASWEGQTLPARQQSVAL